MHYIGKREANYLSLKEIDRKTHNQQYLNKALIRYKEYFDDMFKNINHEICLDEEQRLAILIDEDYEMVIAGAGSGKTTTMVGKVKFLVECLGVEAKDILVISYTNKAVEELRNQIYDIFKIPVKIGTFHHIAFSMLKEITKKSYYIIPDGLSIIYDFIKLKVENNNKLRRQFNRIFYQYFHLDSVYMRVLVGIKECCYSGEKRRKISDDEIQDWYKLSMKYDCSIKFSVVLENLRYPHFCKVNLGDVSIFVDYFEQPLKLSSKFRYYHELFLKRRYHQYHQNHYIVLMRGDCIEERLIHYCKEHCICFSKKTSMDYFMAFVDQKKNYQQFVELIYQFILLWKRTGKKSIKKEKMSEDEQIFIDFSMEAFSYYQQRLREQNALDFEDVISKCTTCLSKKFKKFPEYIIVDEYQDISKERLNLLKKICRLGHSKLIVVGDDWQSIYQFSGSQLDLFTSFQKHFPFSQVVSITNTYRNSQELIDISGNFVMKNRYQFQKKLISLKRLSQPLYFFYYTGVKEKCKKLKFILTKIYQENPEKRVLLLARFHFDFAFFREDKDFYQKDEKLFYRTCPNLSITCLTIHASKGLGFDEVIIVNNKKGIYGFPSLKKTDIYLNLLYEITEEEQLMEERRLFYVSLTRTKNHVYFLIPKTNYSIFIDELKKENTIVSL